MRILLILVASLIFSTSLLAAEANLKGKSEIAQKKAELDALDKQISELETAANAATKKDRAEMAQKKAELDALDKQILEMKLKVGSSSVRSTDNADAIRSMNDQKSNLGKQLEDLKKESYQENKDRWNEVSRLKIDYNNKRRALINKAVANYQKVATSASDQETKDATWQELVIIYPESNKLPMHNLEGYLSMQELALNDGKVVPAKSILSEKQKRLAKGNSTTNNVCTDKCELDKSARESECIRTMTPSDLPLFGPQCIQRARDYYKNCKAACLSGP